MIALVTGGSGLIGRYVTNELLRRGWRVVSIDTRQLDTKIIKSSNFTFIRHDARSLDDTGYNQIYDLVVHCAYDVGGRAAIDGVNANFTRNVQLDSALFEWAIRTKQPRVLYWSSSAVYPVELQTSYFHGRRLSEIDQYVGDPRVRIPDARYGWAKYVGELLAQTARENGVSVSVVRPFSGYAPDQSLDYPFPSFAWRAVRRVSPFTIWGSADQTRDWIHISDVVNAALAVVEANIAGPVNICTGRSTSMRELVAMMMREAHQTEWDTDVLTNAPMGVMHRVGDPTLMNTVYRPKISLEEGIEYAVREVREWVS